MYGCHDLRRGDRDADPANNVAQIWGAQAAAANSICPNPPANPVQPGPQNPVNIPQHVHQLQEDLRTLGFLLVGTPDGNFGKTTEWAVREFQAYAKMERVARIRPAASANARQGAHIVAQLGQQGNLSVYVDSLEQTQNTGRYNGSVSGVANSDTRDAIRHWLDNDYRCPVIVEAWTIQGGNRNQLHQLNGRFGVNLWLHDDWPSSAPRMFVRDFSGYYPLPAGVNANDMIVIGDFQVLPANQTFSGPRSEPPRHTLTQAEILRANLTGQANLNGAPASTFRVVRACSEVECIGFFDSVNCFDNAFVSTGPCHWTLGISGTGAPGPNRPVSEGELCGYLSFLRNADLAAFEGVFQFFGASIEENWVNAQGAASGSVLFSATQRKFTGRV
jgi:hypothetical protein